MRRAGNQDSQLDRFGCGIFTIVTEHLQKGIDLSGPDNRTPRSDKEYIYGLDLVRFSSALAVAAYHLTLLTPGVAIAMPFGWIGVQIFFVISGLVIANSAQGVSVRQFAVSRFLRLYPAAWCAAAVSFPLFLWSAENNGRWFLPLFQSVILLHVFHVGFLASAYWTLPIELAFYFLVFLAILSNCFKHIQWLAIALVLWGAPFLLALGLNSSGLVHWSWVDIGYGPTNMMLFRHGPYFGLGILLWLLKENRISKVGIFAACLALLLGAVEIYGRAVELLAQPVSSSDVFRTSWVKVALTPEIAFCAGFVAIVLSIKFNQLFPKNQILRAAVRLLGLVTYPFYLLHQRVDTYVISQAKRAGLAPILSALIALICSGAIAMLIARYGEPALRRLLKDNLRALRLVRKAPTG